MNKKKKKKTRENVEEWKINLPLACLLNLERRFKDF